MFYLDVEIDGYGLFRWLYLDSRGAGTESSCHHKVLTVVYA